MNDLKNMAIYVAATLAVIFLLLGLAASGTVSSDKIGIIAIILVIVLPVLVAVRVSSKKK
ncbi:MAG: hypothetical protein OEZ47_17010 [Gammaproteobacteria bacterium]|nr:hypothetical protein [Gammaproteobacteria bacterium]